MSEEKVAKTRSPWWWVPSLYYAEGIPYVVVMTVSVIMYKRLGLSNTDIALYTSWLYLPWVIKPLWSPIVDLLKTKRFWIVTMQLIVGAGLAGVALTIPTGPFFQYTLAFFWLLAFSSATHDIAADGFYMLGLDESQQAFFVGIRSTFYRFAMITGQGLLIILAGYFEVSTGLPADVVTVSSKPNTQIVQAINMDSVKISPVDGELRLLVSQTNVQVSTSKIDVAEFDSIKTKIINHNTESGFYKVETAQVKAEESSSAWSKYIVAPLEHVIRKYFGAEIKVVANKNLVGNVGVIYFHLSKKPESNEDIVVNLSRVSGDKSIELIEGTRFVFNQNNWDKTAYALIQLDPKLTYQTEAGFEFSSGNIRLAWVITFSVLAVMFVLFFAYHKFALPVPASDVPAKRGEGSVMGEFFKTFVLFFKKKQIGLILLFLLIYRLGESQIVKLASPFLLDSREAGGLGLTTGHVGLIYGTFGILALTIGGLLGGIVASKKGLKYWILPMALIMNIPHLAYVYLSYAVPDNFFIIALCVSIEQFGYGFGFTAYMLYMIYVSDGEHKTAHYAITTGFMALGMMIPGMLSGWLQELIGYQHFFLWVLIASVPSIAIVFWIKVNPEFGKKK